MFRSERHTPTASFAGYRYLPHTLTRRSQLHLGQLLGRKRLPLVFWISAGLLVVPDGRNRVFHKLKTGSNPSLHASFLFVAFALTHGEKAGLDPNYINRAG